jgi:hypothetical protein
MKDNEFRQFGNPARHLGVVAQLALIAGTQRIFASKPDRQSTFAH